nr:leishmanolysin-like peptidase isoform 2 [Haemonchus contortus]
MSVVPVVNHLTSLLYLAALIALYDCSLVSPDNPRSFVMSPDHPTNTPSNDHSGIRKARSANFDSIRIKMYYDDESVKSLPSDRKELLDGLMKEAISFFESALKVERSEGTRISASCEGSNYINDLGKVICERDCVPKCGKLKIPPEHNIFLPCSCISIACPTDFKPYEGVLEDADFALFVSVSNDESCRPKVYTHSEYCGRDLKTNR